MGLKPQAPDASKAAAQAAAVSGEQFKYNQQATDDTLKKNAMDQSGPFGYSVFNRDPATGLPTGINSGFGPGGLQTGFGNIAENFGAQTGGIPSGINFDTMTAPGIALGNYNAYSALTAPQRAQQLNAINTTLSERGIPLGSEIDNNLRGNFYNSAFIQDQNAAANAWNAVPLHQQILGNNAISQAMAPGQLAGQGVGLMGAGLGLLPKAMQPSAQTGAPNYTGAYTGIMDQMQKQYAADQAGFGNMIKTGIGVAAAPFTGGTSLAMAGGKPNGPAGGSSGDPGNFPK